MAKAHPNREKESLYAMILCGDVSVNAETVRDPKRLISETDVIAFRAPRYVSRGGVKLEHALANFGVDVVGKTVVDAGSSTGGFVDCLLQRGAERVYSIDSGYNQLDYRLRADSRVVVMEKTNILDVHGLNPIPHFATCDISFRTIRVVASHLLQLTSDQIAIVLVKPQFEWKKPYSDFRGVIRDNSVLVDVLEQILVDLADEGAFAGGISESPILGRRGNREFFCYLSSLRTIGGDELKHLIKATVCSQGASKNYRH